MLSISVGIVSQSFMLSDQPNYGNWTIQVDGYVSKGLLNSSIVKVIASPRIMLCFKI